jgi:hypothetical protein
VRWVPSPRVLAYSTIEAPLLNVRGPDALRSLDGESRAAMCNVTPAAPVTTEEQFGEASSEVGSTEVSCYRWISCLSPEKLKLANPLTDQRDWRH